MRFPACWVEEAGGSQGGALPSQTLCHNKTNKVMQGSPRLLRGSFVLTMSAVHTGFLPFLSTEALPAAMTAVAFSPPR